MQPLNWADDYSSSEWQIEADFRDFRGLILTLTLSLSLTLNKQLLLETLVLHLQIGETALGDLKVFWF